MGFQEGVQAERERRADGVAGIAAMAKAPVRALLGYVVPPAWTAVSHHLLLARQPPRI
jgi:hypothetical protein